MLLTRHSNINDVLATFSNTIKLSALMTVQPIEPLDLIKDVYYSNSFLSNKKDIRLKKQITMNNKTLKNNE
jgi:hypothetical protein